MERRIKYIKKNTGWYYAVQIKKWLFWKTIETYATFEYAERFIDELTQIDNFNNKTKSLNKIVYDGWAVRNVYRNIGDASSLYFFKSCPSRSESDKSEIIWKDDYPNCIVIHYGYYDCMAQYGQGVDVIPMDVLIEFNERVNK